MGLDLHYFWSLNPKQYQKHKEAFLLKEKLENQNRDSLNHIMGMYMAYAFNSPKDYPTQPYLLKQKTNLEEMSDEDMERQARRNSIKMGGVINAS